VDNCASSSQAAAATTDNSVVYNNGSDLYAEIGTGQLLMIVSACTVVEKYTVQHIEEHLPCACSIVAK